VSKFLSWLGSANFSAGINTILISPRRWGKSSLVYHTIEQCRKTHPKLKFITIDLFNDEQFYELLARETLRTFSTGTDAIIKTAQKFLGKFLPRITFNPSPELSFELTMDWDEIRKQPHEILMLPELLAKQKGLNVIVCLDEFQNIGHFENQKDFQKVLRATWQLHQNASYCLYGSKRNMMMHVFTSPSMPFYKFGEILFLEKIAEKEWHHFISEKFTGTGKNIDTESLSLITSLTSNHPYYVQQLAHQAWLRTLKICKPDIIFESFDDMTGQMGMLFHSLTDTLSTTQLQFLKALIKGEKHLSSQDVLQKYRLGTSANIQRIKKALLDKEVIDVSGKGYEILDPLYQYWLNEYYFSGKK